MQASQSAVAGMMGAIKHHLSLVLQDLMGNAGLCAISRCFRKRSGVLVTMAAVTVGVLQTVSVLVRQLISVLSQ